MGRNELKTISRTDEELRVANYIILFGGRDLTGEYFTPATSIESAYTKSGMLHVDFEHGLDPDGLDMSADEVLGYVDWKTARIDETGVFVERVLNRRARYMAMLEPLIEDGLVGNSSEAVQGKTARSEGGEILHWPLKRDTLTFTPAEPRMLKGNTLKAARDLRAALPNSKSLAVIDQIPDFKSVLNQAHALKDIESLLRDERGFSRAEATALVCRIKSVLQSESAAKAQTAEIAGLFQSFQTP